MMRMVIVGLGVVGSALYKLYSSSGVEVYGYDVDESRSIHRLEDIPKPVDALHIAIPYTKTFVDTVVSYVRRLDAKAIYIHSTVAVGTTRAVFERVGRPTVYTPVRGIHRKMVEHLRFWSKWIATLPPDYVDEAKRVLELAGMKVYVCRCEPESLELAKLWETVYRAVMIASWQELHRIAKRFGADIAVVAQFLAEVHRVLGDRPIYYPGHIGGHCLIPNTEILNSQYPSKLFEFVLESNRVREQEVQDPEVVRDIERVREIAMELTNREYYA
ncbi:MAG TPA: GDP-mannose dehydrogenase [Ignisphaera aggregans]|uniref:GDP-mannose dehydrogenase n=1 Tax=Ignisphaera aggregans TaxID=334771 RepID=A0A832Z097_9CREN|nr:GDP-mannose dehydrogenase [Ignisphaera aggregans]